ncbi:MAG: TraR/DksA family transcriptional regulator [Chlamydiia bacterium]
MGLSKKELEDFKEILLNMRSQLTRQVKGFAEDAKDLEGVKGSSQHQAEGAGDSSTQNVLLEVASKEVDVVKLIDRALQKIEEGTYGICELTQKPIPKPRLLAIPYAIYTVEAQAMIEKDKKNERHD